MLPDGIQNRNGKSPVAQAVVANPVTLLSPYRNLRRIQISDPHPRLSAEFIYIFKMLVFVPWLFQT